MEYKKFTKYEFINYLTNLKIDRKITHLTLHFLWRKKENLWKNEESIEGLSEYYKLKNRSFAFHVAINENDIWICKDLNLSPDHSGKNNKGSIDIECDAVIGHRQPNKNTWNTYLHTINQLMLKFKLEPQNLYFHSELDSNAINCPDISSKEYFLKKLNEII